MAGIKKLQLIDPCLEHPPLPGKEGYDTVSLKWERIYLAESSSYQIGDGQDSGCHNPKQTSIASHYHEIHKVYMR